MTAQAERLFVTWFRSGADGQEHAVTDEEAARAYHASADAESVCGHYVVPLSLTSPPGRKCPRCLAYLLARATLTDLDLRMTPRRIRFSFRRLFHRRSGRSVTSCAPRTDRPEPDHGGSAETPISGRAAVHHPKECSCC
ncbi:hypothetical protein [Saccharopolyspora pogona]|uniref:hypothetical protein n=1 Tax=Saccharopolyspora pogona TaxID=333966 RepID=UPI001683C558|nr:hypothetical protein [Saccharopolyspora pogona]